MHRGIGTGATKTLAALLILSLAAGCGGGGDNPTQPPAPTPTSVNGNVTLGANVGASVTIHKINSNGTINSAVVAGPYTTDANGNWSGTIPAGASGPFVMVSTGGTYTDEATGTAVTVPAGRELYGIYQSGTSVVTPLTHATFLSMQARVTGGASLSDAITQATQTATTAFGVNFATSVPSDLITAVTNEKEYAALLGGVSRLLDANPALIAFVNTWTVDLVLAIVKDMADGKLDGRDAYGNVILVYTDHTGATTAPLPALSSTDLSAWLTQANLYAATIAALNGIVFNVNTTWNPSGSTGGGALGTLTFTGPGAAFLPNPKAATPDSSYSPSVGVWEWYDRAHHYEITVHQSGGTGDIVGSVSITYSVGAVYHNWSRGGFPGIPNTSIAGGQGGTTTFTNCALAENAVGPDSLIVSGTLTNPTWVHP